jgi:formylglycine-generating enzyme required for sulfatase activity
MRKSKYSKEFQDSIVQLIINNNESVVNVAHDLGLKEKRLYRWVTSYKEAHNIPTENVSFINTNETLDVEIKCLLRELKIAKQEMDILKKAIVYFAKDFTNSIGMTFKDIPSGSFMMGAESHKDDPFISKDESLRSSDELPYHKVKIKSFYMASTTVTQMQYYKVMGKNPAHFKTDKLGYDSRNNPIEKVSWDDANKFVRKLNSMESTDKYRLPTEEEWEYSARAGSKTKWYFGNDESSLKNYAWYDKNAYDMDKGNSGYGTHPVATKKPNKFELYDMHGNVWEWTSNCYTETYDSDCYKNFKVLRGGSWTDDARGTRSAYRNYDSPGNRGNCLGFRLARTK